MSEMDFGSEREQDFYVYGHMRTAASTRKPGQNVLKPSIEHAFAILDQKVLCEAQGIDSRRIQVGAAIAHIDALNEVMSGIRDRQTQEQPYDG